MSLLNQDTKELDDAALGEEFTKGSGHVLWAAVIATIVVSASIAIYFIAGQKPPAATGEVVAIWAHPQHTETSGLDANGAPMAKESFDQILVFTEVKLHNQSKEPLFLEGALTNATLADGIHSSYAASQVDYERVFLAYPGLTVPHGTPLSTSLELAPGQTVDGTFVSSFKLTKEEWDARKSVNFSLNFKYQPSLVLTPQGSITEQ